jgi:alcohol dehydrogenase
MIPEYYEFSCQVKIISGLKALSNLPFEMDLLGAHRALIVTDQGVVNAGLIKQVTSAFEGSNCEIGAIFDQTPPDSSKDIVNQVARLYRENNCDCFVAVGGGSSMDTAKCANMIVTEGTDDLMSFQGAERLKKPMKPFVAIPTTAGTGSEVTLAAVIYDADTNTKMAFTSYRLLPDVAILDPKMTMTMPAKITAATAMDALTHAVEAYYCLGKNPVSDSFSKAAITLIMENLLKCIQNPGDEGARLAMANAALLAGISFSNSMVGVVHSLAHACGGVARVPHGVANAILLPWGMENNLEKAGHIIAELAPLLGAEAKGSQMDQAKAAIQAVRDMQKRLKEMADLPTALRDAGVKEDQLEDIARAAINDGAVTYNPEDVTYETALEILKKAF